MSKNKNERNNPTFLSKMEKKYGKKYTLISEYINSETKSIFKCNEHDVLFEQKPVVFIRGHVGCQKCNGKTKWTTESFIEESVKIHGDKFNYSQSLYVNTTTPIKIKCPEHGVFEMRIHSHIKGQGCPKCKNFKPVLGNEKFIEKAINVHGDKYNYDKVDYVKSNKKVIITCPTHGDFEQLPAKHLSGNGCKKCSDQKMKDLYKLSSDEIKNRFIKTHGNKYNYDKVDYVNMLTKVIITCPTHGDFEQVPGDHIGGHGCIMCSSSVSEEENNFFNELNIDGVIRSSTKFIYPLQLDGYLPEFKIGIEYCGLYYHSTERLDKNYHLDKLNKCRENGIRLIQVFSDEWFLKKEIVKSRINSIIGKYNRIIYGRKTKVGLVDKTLSRDFLNENHLQGSVNSTINIGLYFDDELVSLMTFNKPRKGIGGSKFDFELSRYCVKKGVNIIGGAKKLLSFFEKNNPDKSIVSYADLRWSEGEIYLKMGFDKLYETKPNYSYLIGKHRESRLKFTKSRLKKEGFDITKTEEEIMLERNIYKVYDCGVITFVKNLKK